MVQVKDPEKTKTEKTNTYIDKLYSRSVDPENDDKKESYPCCGSHTVSLVQHRLQSKPEQPP